MIWTRQEDEEKERIKHAEYVSQWEEENNARVLSRDGRSGRPEPTTKSDGVSTPSGLASQSLPRHDERKGEDTGS